MKKCVCEKASVDMFSLQPLDPLFDILLTVVSKLCKLGSRATYRYSISFSESLSVTNSITILLLVLSITMKWESQTEARCFCFDNEFVGIVLGGIIKLYPSQTIADW